MSVGLRRRRSQFDGALASDQVAAARAGGCCCCCCCCCIATAITGLAFPALDVNGYAHRSRQPTGTRYLLTLGASLSLVPLSVLIVALGLAVLPRLGNVTGLSFLLVLPGVALALVYWRAGGPWARGVLVWVGTWVLIVIDVVFAIVFLRALPVYIALAGALGVGAVTLGVAARRSHMGEPPPPPPPPPTPIPS